MRNVAHLAPVVSTAALDGTLLAIEVWRTVAPSETTGLALPKGAEPLRPARDPINAGRTVPVAWAGRCEGCYAPMWAAVMPTRAELARERRCCPGCGGAAVFRPWLVWRQPPPAVPGTRPNGAVAAPRKSVVCPPEESRASNTVRMTPGPRAPLGEARARLRRIARPRQTPAAWARAYRTRRRAHLAPAAGSR